MPRHGRAGRAWTVAALALAALSCVPWAATALAPPPLVYRNLPFPVTTTPLHPGDTVPLVVDRCVSGDAPLVYTFTRTLVPEQAGRPGVVLPPAGSLAAPGCLVVDSRAAELPDQMRPGRYHLEAVTTVAGPWKTWQIHWQSEPFEVVPHEGS